MKLYEHPLSPYAQKVKISLYEKGIEVTETLLTRIQNFHHRGSVPNSIRVFIPAESS